MVYHRSKLAYNYALFNSKITPWHEQKYLPVNSASGRRSNET